jgi:octaprenyl-diphosphate synthase
MTSSTGHATGNAPTRTRTPANGALRDIQAPVADRLEDVVVEMQRIAAADLPLIREVSGHLLQMRGKMFRPTLALLASAATGAPQARAVTLAAAVELMHLATLVHDDSVDHSVLRRGLPTVNSLFSHQVSVIMGDFLYTHGPSWVWCEWATWRSCASSRTSRTSSRLERCGSSQRSTR